MFAPAVNVPPLLSVVFPLTVSVAGAVKLPVFTSKLFTVNEVMLPPMFTAVPAITT